MLPVNPSQPRRTRNFAEFALICACAFTSLFAATKFETLHGFEPHFVLPDDQTIVKNIKSDYGAAGDGQTDDTQAFKDWLAAKERRLYIPAGTYLVDEQLRFADGMKKVVILGEKRSTTTIKLAANSSGFGDASSPKAFIHLRAEQESPEQNFFNCIYHLTIEIGKGNAGAIALNYHTNNTGTIKDITIKASDISDKGFIGLALDDHSFGPGSIRFAEIEGFEYGIYVGNSQNRSTLEHITVKNCGTGIYACGITWHLRFAATDALTWNDIYAARATISRDSLDSMSINDIREHIKVGHGYGTSMRKVTTDSCDLGMKFEIGDTTKFGHAGHAVIKDIELTGGSGGPAIENDGQLLVSNLSVGGYTAAIHSSTPAGNKSGTSISHYSSHDVIYNWQPAPAKDITLGIEPKESPELQYPQTSSDWTVIAQTDGDVTSELQSAIDNGAKNIYLQGGEIASTILLRNNLQRIMGLGSHPQYRFSTGASPAFSLEDGNSDYVIIDMLYSRGGDTDTLYQHNAARTLIIRNSSISYISTSAASGADLFLESVVGDPIRLRGVNAYVRGVNTERGEDTTSVDFTNIVNDNSIAWVLGHKTEDFATKFKTVNGGKTEVLGATYRQNWSESKIEPLLEDHPLYVIENAHATFAFVTWKAWWKASGNYKYLVREVRGNETKEIVHAQYDAPNGYRGEQSLFVGYTESVGISNWKRLTKQHLQLRKTAGVLEIYSLHGRLIHSQKLSTAVNPDAHVQEATIMLPTGFYTFVLRNAQRDIISSRKLFRM
ncbi:MAG: hypothetical protein GF398_00320 [Chitinivibrionales bacterium]|nr:hypothetical protein [Chitinivibrionales bacterium]